MNSNKRDILFCGGCSKPIDNHDPNCPFYEELDTALPTPAPVAEQECLRHKDLVTNVDYGCTCKGTIPTLPKEAEGKAKELMEKFYEVLLVDGSLNEKRICWGYAKQCALICVDEILDAIDNPYYSMPQDSINYWQQVRTAINQL